MRCASILAVCVCVEYAQVIKMLGNGRLEAMCFDGVKRLCHIRGKLRKKVHTQYLILTRPISECLLRTVRDNKSKHIVYNPVFFPFSSWR